MTPIETARDPEAVFSPRRRALLAGAALLPLVTVRAVAQEGGDVPALKSFLSVARETVKRGRVAVGR